MSDCLIVVRYRSKLTGWLFFRFSLHSHRVTMKTAQISIIPLDGAEPENIAIFF